MNLQYWQLIAHDLTAILRKANGGWKHPSANAHRHTYKRGAEWAHWVDIHGAIVSSRLLK